MERFVEWLTQKMSRPTTRRSFLDRTAAVGAALAAMMFGPWAGEAHAKKKKPPKKKPPRVQCCEYTCSKPGGPVTLRTCGHGGNCAETLKQRGVCHDCVRQSVNDVANCSACNTNVGEVCDGPAIKKKKKKSPRQRSTR